MKTVSYLLTAILLATPAMAGTVSLANSWSEYDWNQSNPVSPNAGNVALSGQSNTGFTAAVGQNTLNIDSNAASIDSTGRPRVFQTFTPQALSALGDTVSMSFQLTSGTAMVVGDSAFRFALADTTRNQGIWASIDFGTPGGNASTTRFDNSITDPGVSATYTGGNFGHFLNSGTTRGSSGTIPNNVGFGAAGTLSTVHSLSLSVTRVVGGLSWTYSWGNDAGAAVTTVTIGSTFDDGIIQTDGANSPMNSINGIAFLLSNDAPYGTGTTGNFTVSNMVVTGVNAVPEPSFTSLLLAATGLGAARRRR